MSTEKTLLNGVSTKDSSEDNLWLHNKGLHGCPPLLRTTPGNVSLPKTYASLASAIYNFKFRSDDILVLSQPRTGTTWTSEMLWAMTHIEQLDKAEEENPWERVFFFDSDFLDIAFNSDRSATRMKFQKECPLGQEDDGMVLQLAAAYNKRRVIRTHLPLSLLNPNILDTCKVVSVCRNPKDTCVSRFHLVSNVSHQNYYGDLEDFLDIFMSDRLPFGGYWNFIREIWPMRHHPNLKIVFYEDLTTNLLGELRKLNSFAQTNLSDKDLQKVVAHSQFDAMRARGQKNPVIDMRKDFYRKGKSGSWKEDLSPEAIARLDAWIEEQSLEMGITFKYK